MSIKVGIDATSWLQQDGAESPADTMPDTTGDLSIIGWTNNLMPAVVLPAYKVEFVAFSTADLANPSYNDPYIEVVIEQVDGQQAIALDLGNSGEQTTPFVPTGIEKRAYLITYDGTSHIWTFAIRRTAAWDIVGTLTSDFSGVTFTQMRRLNDGIASGSIGSMSGGYWRLYNGKKLTLIEAENEALSGVAVTAGVTTDTPLIAVTDLTDVSGGNSPWYQVGMGLETALPGPLTADVSFLMVPESDHATSSDVTFLVAGKATTTGSAQSTVAVTQIVAATAHPTVAACFKRDGGWWQATDNGGVTNLVEFDSTGAILRTVVMAVKIGNGVGCTSNLMELDGGDLLSIVRATGAVVRIAAADGTVAQTYGLTLTTLDGAVNSRGTRLVYIDSLDVKAWDLENDLDLGTLFTVTNQLRCLVWLADCTLIATAATYLGDGTIERYNLTGDLLHSYAYDPSLFDEGQYGIAASAAANRLWVIGDWDNGASSEQPGVLIFDLSSGAQLGPVVPLVGELSDKDVVSSIAQPVVPIMCDPFPPAPKTSTYPVRRLSRKKLLYEKNIMLFVSRLELKMQTGIGTVDIPDPQVMLRMSYDGGQTFGNILTCSGGKMGEYLQRVYWNRLGRGRDIVVEISTSDPVPWYFDEILVDVTEGTS